MDNFLVLWITAVLIGSTLFIFGASGVFILTGVLFAFHLLYRAFTGNWFDSD